MPLLQRNNSFLRISQDSVPPAECDFGADCPSCGETIIAPDGSIFVNERLTLNLWCCTECGERFRIWSYRRFGQLAESLACR